MTIGAYVHEVLDRYVSLPDTPGRPRRSDRAVARRWFSENVPLSLVFNAMLLATIRRSFRDLSLSSLEPIHSLHYFIPVIRFLEADPIDPFYFKYLAYKLEDLEQTKNLTNERKAR